jgi:hypothetical protein
MYAAIGTDGVRLVVWGMGETAEASIAEARSELREAGLGIEGEVDAPNGVEIDTREITASDANAIKAGDVDAASLGRE